MHAHINIADTAKMPNDTIGSTNVLKLFEDMVNQCPTNVALRYDIFTMTYRELSEKVKIAADALHVCDVGPSVRVGLALQRHPLAIIITMATMRIGGVFVPIDPDWPLERARIIAEDADIALLVAPERRCDALRRLGVRVISAEGLLEEGTASLALAPLAPHNTGPGELCYIMYTSGSTVSVRLTARSESNRSEDAHAQTLDAAQATGVYSPTR